MQIPLPYILAFVLLLTGTMPAHSQNKFRVSGTIKDSITGEILIGATISVQDKISGTITDHEGRFQLEITTKDSAVLLVSYVGYETKTVVLKSSDDQLVISLNENFIAAKEVVVTASRISEKILEAPVTILKMDAYHVKETPSENFYSALASFKGVDVLTNSLLYKTLNTRGFSNNANFRMVQLIDGVDNSLVGLGWPFGNVLGATDLDIEKVELIPGVASALYGANAFNGLLYMTTKNPFDYQGLSVLLKNGVNNLGNDESSSGWYADLQLRYAKAFNDRFGFKVNFGYVRGDDWLLTDSSDISLNTPDNIRGPDNPARDAVNIYGDETVKASAVTDTNGTAWNVTRTGYYVKDLIDQSTYSLKANGALYYRLNDHLEMSSSFNFAQATTSYSSMFSLKDILMYSGKLELTGAHFFARASALKDDLGETYNAGLLGGSINRYWKSNNSWFSDFATAFNGNVSGVAANDFVAARGYADVGRLIPGTEAFNHVFDSLRSIPFSSGGAKVIDHSSKFYLQGEYDFSNDLHFMNLVAGADYRYTNLNSEGTIFTDTIGSPIGINQYALYAQATKKFFRERVKLLAAIRYDKADNFDGVWAPRFAAVYHPDAHNYFRGSFQTGFRLPDPQLQFMDILTAVGHRLGGTEAVDAPYQSRPNSFTGTSVSVFNDSVNKFLAANAGTLDEAINRYYNILEKTPYDYIQPEKVQTIEVGYQRLLFDEKIYADVNYFHNSYDGFIYTTSLIKPASGGTENEDSIKAAAYAIHDKKYETFITVVNSSDKIIEDGIELGASFIFPRKYVISGNLTWIHSNVTPDKSAPGIRTPPLKSNINISNRNVIKGVGFMINWRWTDAVDNWSNASDAANIDNSLPAYSIIDLQISYRIPRAATSIKLGASNLLNFYHQDFAQGPSVGGLYYISLLYDGVFK